MKGAAAGVALLSTILWTGACSFLSPSASNDAGPQIVIAGEFPLGDLEPSSIDADRAAAIAVANHPTVGGYRLRYESFDDILAGHLDGDKALQNARRMVLESRTLGVVGPWNSPMAMLVVPITDKAHLVMLSPSTTNDCLTARPATCLSDHKAAGNFFRIATPQSEGARAEARLAIMKGLKNFAVLNDGSVHGIETAGGFTAEVESDGGKVVFSETYDWLAKSYASLLRKIRDAHAEAMFVGTTGPEVCRMRAEMSGVFSTNIYLFSGEEVIGPDCLAAAGKAADDHFVGLILQGQPTTIPASLRSLHHIEQDKLDYVFGAYDCAEILIAAIESAIRHHGGKIPTREQVVEAVAATHEFKGITGRYSFLSNGDTSNPGVSLYYVRSGKWTLWQNI